MTSSIQGSGSRPSIGPYLRQPQPHLRPAKAQSAGPPDSAPAAAPSAAESPRPRPDSLKPRRTASSELELLRSELGPDCRCPAPDVQEPGDARLDDARHTLPCGTLSHFLSARHPSQETTEFKDRRQRIADLLERVLEVRLLLTYGSVELLEDDMSRPSGVIARSWNGRLEKVDGGQPVDRLLWPASNQAPAVSRRCRRRNPSRSCSPSVHGGPSRIEQLDGSDAGVRSWLSDRSGTRRLQRQKSGRRCGVRRAC